MNKKIILKKKDNITFGILFCTIFLVIALYPLKDEGTIRLWSIYIMVIFALITIIRPSLFTFINKLWIKLGFMLGRVISPFVMAFIFFVIVTPIGILLRIFQKDVMRLKKKKYTYWINGENKIQSMKKQF
ncbi:MAG: hypothetical protein CMI85_03925 [Candidatus Pelagibacter sp.]|nr:hypothetical protein [Candidatus Pelagibacter sp.]|tara:strand:+ start:5328 stop:5717 length:390 start_codon:yes stop_codon:yes gene_type:complete